MTKRLPMDDPVFVNYLRLAYVSAQLLVFGMYFYITTVVCFLHPSGATPLLERLGMLWHSRRYAGVWTVPD